MSNIALLIHVGGTKMTVDFHDHFQPTPMQIGLGDSVPRVPHSATCLHCGVLVLDFEQHLVWHVEVIKDFSLRAEPEPSQTGAVMPQDVEGDEVGAPERPAERRLHACKTCGHIHKGDFMCGQPLRGNPANPCPCEEAP